MSSERAEKLMHDARLKLAGENFDECNRLCDEALALPESEKDQDSGTGLRGFDAEITDMKEEAAAMFHTADAMDKGRDALDVEAWVTAIAEFEKALGVRWPKDLEMDPDDEDEANEGVDQASAAIAAAEEADFNARESLSYQAAVQQQLVATKAAEVKARIVVHELAAKKEKEAEAERVHKTEMVAAKKKHAAELEQAAADAAAKKQADEANAAAEAAAAKKRAAELKRIEAEHKKEAERLAKERAAEAKKAADAAKAREAARLKQERERQAHEAAAAKKKADKERARHKAKAAAREKAHHAALKAAAADKAEQERLRKAKEEADRAAEAELQARLQAQERRRQELEAEKAAARKKKEAQLKESRKKREVHAATMVESHFRGTMARKKVAGIRKQNADDEAAIPMMCCYLLVLFIFVLLLVAYLVPQLWLLGAIECGGTVTKTIQIADTDFQFRSQSCRLPDGQKAQLIWHPVFLKGGGKKKDLHPHHPLKVGSVVVKNSLPAVSSLGLAHSRADIVAYLTKQHNKHPWDVPLTANDHYKDKRLGWCKTHEEACDPENHVKGLVEKHFKEEM